jgi:hypothetical protein
MLKEVSERLIRQTHNKKKYKLDLEQADASMNSAYFLGGIYI